MGKLDNMFNSKYSKTLTVVLIIIIIAVIALLGYLAYDAFKTNKIESEAAEAVSLFENTVSQTDTNETTETVDPNIDLNSLYSTSSSSSGTTVTYQGYEVIGTIKIPAIDIEYPIIKQEDVSAQSLKVAICNLYGSLNTYGENAVLVGHNYRNGTFFSNNKNLEIGDKIYITDTSGNKVTYYVYKKYETSSGDFDYATRDVDSDTMEISLSTCTDDSSKRLIIWAKTETEE